MASGGGGVRRRRRRHRRRDSRGWPLVQICANLVALNMIATGPMQPYAMRLRENQSPQLFGAHLGIRTELATRSFIGANGSLSSCQLLHPTIAASHLVLRTLRGQIVETANDEDDKQQAPSCFPAREISATLIMTLVVSQSARTDKLAKAQTGRSVRVRSDRACQER